MVPLTKAMKSGKAPLRTFGDLAQFFDLKTGKTEQEQASQEKPRKDPSAPAADAQSPADSQAIVESQAAAAPVSTGSMPPVADQQEAMPPTAIDRPVEVPVEQVGPPPAQDEAAASAQESPPEMEPRPEQGRDEPTA